MDHMAAGAAMDGQVPLGPVAVPVGPVVKIYIPSAGCLPFRKQLLFF